MSHKKLFQPKFPECKVQCPSCPFRTGNNKEFGEIVNRLETSVGLPGRVTRRQIGSVRLRIMSDVGQRGDFACHLTAYNPDMTRKPTSEFRQCKGATEFYRNS